ncbi:hypothetical protein V6N13_057080 [Hibiscus sabdariffa]
MTLAIYMSSIALKQLKVFSQQDLATAQIVGGVVSSQPFGDGRAAKPQLSLIVTESLLLGSPHRVNLDAVVNNEIVSERALEDV